MLNTQGAQDLFPHLFSFPFFIVASYAVSPLNAEIVTRKKFTHTYFIYLFIENF